MRLSPVGAFRASCGACPEVTMSVIVIRLLPQKPVDDGDDFVGYLEGLEISLSDRSFGNPAGGDAAHQLGTARYLTEGDPNATIVQHLRPPALLDRAPVATAAIEVPDPLPFAEYQNADLALVVTRTAGANPPQTIQIKEFHFNVDTVTGTLPGNNSPITYAGMGPPAAYLYLPKPLIGLAPGTAHVQVPTDGSAPPYAAVRAAIQTVLAADPGAGAPSLADLTPAQCRHLAWEIVANHALDPLPEPDGDLEKLYLGDDETARQQFEADLVTYYATQAGNADVIAKFAYAVAAAEACRQLSQSASRAGLAVPVFPGLAGPVAPVVVSQ
jgi:hypothetical protein